MKPVNRSSRINLVQRTLLLTSLMLHQLVQINGTSTEEAVPLSVTRRLQNPDILIFTNSTRHRNCYAHTFLVDERRCVSNQVLHEGICTFVINYCLDI